MRKVVSVFLMALLLVACGTEYKVKSRMEHTLREFAHDPDALEIDSVNTMYETDSLYIIHAIVRNKDVFGTYVSRNVEYVFLIGNGACSEALINLDREKSLMEEASYRAFEAYGTPLGTIDRQLYIMAVMKCTFDGRKVE